MSRSRLKILPKPQGPFPTGCVDLMWGRTQNGTLLRLYYPISSDQIDERKLMPWFPGYEYTKGLSIFTCTSLPFLVEGTFNWYTKDTKIASALDAPVAEDKFPLIIFSHGLGGHRTIYSMVCNDLASYGFIVAAVEHRDESACATFTLSESGEKIYMYYKNLGKNEEEYPLRHQQVEIRANECIEALNVLKLLTEGNIETNELPCSLPIKSFEGKIDTSRPILAGHSFGGATTILALSKDKRFKLGLSLDPWMFPLRKDLENLSVEVTQPMLIVLTEGFLNEVNVKSLLPFNNNRNTFITLKGAVHLSQSDMPFLFGFLGRVFSGCRASADRHRTITLNNRLMINFIYEVMGIGIDSYESYLDDHSEYLLKGLSDMAKDKYGWDLDESSS